jgi:hypothetical protein
VSLAEGARLFLKWDETFVFLGSAGWILLCFRGLKKEGRTDANWVKLFAVLMGTGILFGPGVSMAGMRAWREEALAGE